jgi:hypothetical protein
MRPNPAANLGDRAPAASHASRAPGRCVVDMRARPIIIAAVVILATVAVGAVALHRAKERAGFIGCGNYLVSIGCAARLWANDNGDRLPPDLISMSNEVITPKILVCPGDRSRQPAASWASFTPEQSSFQVVTPSLRDGDTNRVFLRCKIHGSILYGEGSVFVHGQRHHKY